MVAFFLIATLVLLSAVGVVVLKNPIYSALSLILTLLGVAAVFALLQAPFLAAVQVLVYAGAIMVLVVFVLMLLGASREEESLRLERRSMIPVYAGAIVALSLMPAVYVGSVMTGEVIGTTRAIGLELFGPWVFTFELASLLIMAALVAAVLLGRRSKTKVREE